MKRIMTVVWIGLLVTAIPGFLSCNTSQNKHSSQLNKAAQLSVADFNKLLSEHPEAQLVDVREPEELKYGYIPGAINIDFNAATFEADLKDKLVNSKPVLVYCMSGVRSEKAAGILRKLGFAEVYDLSGGFIAWEKAGLPVGK